MTSSVEEAGTPAQCTGFFSLAFGASCLPVSHCYGRFIRYEQGFLKDATAEPATVDNSGMGYHHYAVAKRVRDFRPSRLKMVCRFSPSEHFVRFALSDDGAVLP